MMSIKRW